MPEKKPPPPKEEKADEDPDAELEAAWRRSPIGIRIDPKHYIKGLVYTEDDKA